MSDYGKFKRSNNKPQQFTPSDRSIKADKKPQVTDNLFSKKYSFIGNCLFWKASILMKITEFEHLKSIKPDPV